MLGACFRSQDGQEPARATCQLFPVEGEWVWGASARVKRVHVCLTVEEERGTKKSTVLQEIILEGKLPLNLASAVFLQEI